MYKRQVLDDINACFSCASGENGGRIYGIQGINGSGKTMLMRVICGLVLPTMGTVSIDGEMCIRDSGKIVLCLLCLASLQHPGKGRDVMPKIVRHFALCGVGAAQGINCLLYTSCGYCFWTLFRLPCWASMATFSPAPLRWRNFRSRFPL